MSACSTGLGEARLALSRSHCTPLQAGWLAGWLAALSLPFAARSLLALPLALAGGMGGACILAVGAESELALLVSRRAQLQPRGPARPPAARPGLLGWARARPGAELEQELGAGQRLHPAPFPPLLAQGAWS